VVEKGEDLFLAEDHGQLVSAADVGEILAGPGHLQGGQIKELERGNALVDGFRRELALVEKVELILADSLAIEDLGAAAEVAGEGGDVMDDRRAAFGE
jgi:hypothetical protein